MRIISFLVNFFFFSTFCQSGFTQEIDRFTLSSGYDEVSGTEPNGEWILGELFIGELTHGNTIIQQGLLHGSPLTTSVSNLEDGTIVAIYPNPCSNFVYVTHTNAKPIPLSIYNLSGSLIKRITDLSTQSEINLRDLRIGTYLFIVKINDRRPYWIPIFKME